MLVLACDASPCLRHCVLIRKMGSDSYDTLFICGISHNKKYLLNKYTYQIYRMVTIFKMIKITLNFGILVNLRRCSSYCPFSYLKHNIKGTRRRHKPVLIYQYILLDILLIGAGLMQLGPVKQSSRKISRHFRPPLADKIVRTSSITS